jgi:sugar O-acyltransferase (sialic acid O-acetyltransferase NeuD family)
MVNIIVLGSGGHAKVIIDILHMMDKYAIIGITSISLKKGELFSGYIVLGEDSIIAEYNPENHRIAMGLGGFRDNRIREKAFYYVKSLRFNFLNVIHPSAIISETSKLGEGVTIFPGVVINTNTTIGDNSIIATGSTIDHETVIGNNVLISAGVTIGAYAKINDGALIALGAKVISGVNIGKNAVVAAGAVVIDDVFADQTVYGIPAKPKIG